MSNVNSTLKKDFERKTPCRRIQNDRGSFSVVKRILLKKEGGCIQASFFDLGVKVHSYFSTLMPAVSRISREKASG